MRRPIQPDEKTKHGDLFRQIQVSRLNASMKAAQGVRKLAFEYSKPTTTTEFSLRLIQVQDKRQERKKKFEDNASAPTEDSFRLQGTWFETVEHHTSLVPSAEPELLQDFQSLRLGWDQIPSDSLPEPPQVFSEDTESHQRVKDMRMLNVAWRRSSMAKTGVHITKLVEEKLSMLDGQHKLQVTTSHLTGIHHDVQAIYAGQEILERTMSDTAARLKKRKVRRNRRTLEQSDVSYMLRSRGYGSPLVNVMSTADVEDEQAWQQIDQPVSDEVRNWELLGRKMIAGKVALKNPGMLSDRSGIEAPQYGKAEHVDW